MMHQNTIELCESFLINNTTLENWEIIYSTAHSLGSKFILSHLRDFIKNNYQHVIKSNAFLHLRENDLIEIIKSQDLVVPKEDVVIESILNWVKNGNQSRSETTAEDQIDDGSSVSVENEQSRQTEKNLRQSLDQNKIVGCKGKNAALKLANINKNRLRCLERFLSETRLCLVSSITLEKLSRDNLLMDNKRIRAMVMDAALYKSMGQQHGQSLKAAVHRSCSGLTNVGVVGRQYGNFNTFSFQPEFQWLNLSKCTFLVNCTCVKLIAYQTYFIAVGDLVEYSSVCVFVQNEWRELMILSSHGWLGVAVEEFIYLINSSNQQIKRFDPRNFNCLLEDFISFPKQNKIEHVCSFDFFILAFCSEEIDETAVHCLDTRSQTWTRLDSLEGSANNMHSFREEKQLYILQANGNLWEINIEEMNGVHLKLVEVLWQGTSKVFGVIYIDERLCLCFSKESENDVASSSTSKLFAKISNVFSPTQFLPWSNIVPAVVKSHSR
ncbi:unnamed protein product [Lymnaea stagnalis]|uniref:BACK domain-containing protein n=1 Tax=Lymnaea stagnalis TaxID=6523 RepID=A0AAV2I8C6_LYMST